MLVLGFLPVVYGIVRTSKKEKEEEERKGDSAHPRFAGSVVGGCRTEDGCGTCFRTLLSRRVA